jgi:hypothetical protein
MANLIGMGTVVQVFYDTSTVTIRPSGLNVEQSFTVNYPIDSNIMPGVSVVFCYDDGSCVRQSADPIPDE